MTKQQQNVVTQKISVMKTFNITNRLSAQARKEIERIIATHDKYKKAYFFHPDSSAGGRRKNESKFLKQNPDVAFVKGDVTIVVTMIYTESCNNVYYSMTVKEVHPDGTEVVKNITAIKSLLK